MKDKDMDIAMKGSKDRSMTIKMSRSITNNRKNTMKEIQGTRKLREASLLRRSKSRTNFIRIRNLKIPNKDRTFKRQRQIFSCKKGTKIFSSQNSR